MVGARGSLGHPFLLEEGFGGYEWCPEPGEVEEVVLVPCLSDALRGGRWSEMCPPVGSRGTDDGDFLQGASSCGSWLTYGASWWRWWWWWWRCGPCKLSPRSRPLVASKGLLGAGVEGPKKSTPPEPTRPRPQALCKPREGEERAAAWPITIRCTC